MVIMVWEMSVAFFFILAFWIHFKFGGLFVGLGFFFFKVQCFAGPSSFQLQLIQKSSKTALQTVKT